MKTLTILFLALLSQNIMAETFTVGKFASFDAKEDGSVVEVVSSKVTVFAETTGVSLSLKGCNVGKVTTGEPGIYGTSYKPVSLEKVIPSNVSSKSTIEISNAVKNLASLKSSLKNKVSFYCKTEASIVVEATVRVVKTNRLVDTVFTINSTTEGLVVDSVEGQIALGSAVTVLEIPN
ncbi:MAG: hypothetical protein K2Q18_18260 [Bdellovibrionales bacterium]|nr:hypothetical protein [Bdellovibrionales bacterium]